MVVSARHRDSVERSERARRHNNLNEPSFDTGASPYKRATKDPE